MKKVQITCDSTADLSPEVLAQYGVEVLPLWTTLGAETFRDGVDVKPSQLYEYFDKTGELPKTSAPNIADASSFFQKFADQGMAVVHFTISSEMSSSCQNAKVAAEDFEDIYVVDSRSLSSGVGLLVLKACDLAAEGKSAEEIASVCSGLVGRVDASFIIDDLTYLKAGGRCSAAAAFGANLLNIKPYVRVKDGVMSVPKKYRGKFEKIYFQYIQDILGDGTGLDLTRVFITRSSDLLIDYLEDAKKLVLSIAPFKEVIFANAGSTICSHCGPACTGVLFIHEKDI